MNSDIQLQKIFVDDASLLGTVALKAYRDHYLHLWYDAGEWYTEKCFTAKHLAEEIADQNALFFLVKYKEDYAGFLKLNIDAALKEHDKTTALELERIYLGKHVAGKGVGSCLLTYTFELARSKQKKIVWLKVMDSSLSAIRFYEKHGFEICGTQHLDFPQMKEEYRGMLIMRKEL